MVVVVVNVLYLLCLVPHLYFKDDTFSSKLDDTFLRLREEKSNAQLVFHRAVQLREHSFQMSEN